MICRNCGAKIKNNALFCTKCGAEVSNRTAPDYPDYTGRTPSPVLIMLSGCGVVLLAFAAVLIIFFVIPSAQNKKAEEEARQEAEAALPEEPIVTMGEEAVEIPEEEPAEEEVPSEEEAEEDSEEEKPEEEDEAGEFAIKSDTEEDYEKVAREADFKSYENPDISLFSFSYPTNLFNEVEQTRGDLENDYGTHLETVAFRGSEGSALTVRVFRRNDDADLQAASRFVRDKEAMSISNLNELTPITGDNGTTFFVQAGEDPEDSDILVFNLVRLTDEYVYQMRICFPDYEDDEDRAAKDYYMECLRRSCGFTTDGEAVRSFDDFKNEGEAD